MLPDAVKVSAEDGRRVEAVDISNFINNLPGGSSTVAFRSDDASGSTSQAANIQVGVDSGCCCCCCRQKYSIVQCVVCCAHIGRFQGCAVEACCSARRRVYALLLFNMRCHMFDVERRRRRSWVRPCC